VSLDAPERQLLTTSSQKQQYSQRIVDAVSLKGGDVQGYPVSVLAGKLPDDLKKRLFSHNTETERMFWERGERREVLYVSCDGITGNSALMRDMRDILEVIQEEYAYPVDTEYTINFAQDGSYVIDLLQCRPLQLTKEGDEVRFPENTGEQDVLLETRGVSMGFSREIGIDAVVLIDPIGYYELPYRRKYEVKSLLSKVNWHYRGMNKHLLLLAPGRICTSSPELGVPSAFSDISEFSVIAEISESSVGYVPELSYGSHIFQDLVEAGILYTAVFEAESTVSYRPGLLDRFREVTESITSLPEDLREIFRVFETEHEGLTLYYDLGVDRLQVIAVRRE